MLSHWHQMTFVISGMESKSPYMSHVKKIINKYDKTSCDSDLRSILIAKYFNYYMIQKF